MRSMHQRFTEPLSPEVTTLSQQTQLAALQGHIQHYQRNFDPSLKLEFLQREEDDDEPDLEMPEKMRSLLNESQSSQIRGLIRQYVEGGLKLMFGLGQIARQQKLYDNSAEMMKIQEEMKELSDPINEGTEEDSEERKPGRIGLYLDQLPAANANQPQAPAQRISSINSFAQSFGRKKKAALSEKQIESLQADLKNPNLNKHQIQKKYDISQSTLNRYVRRFREWEENQLLIRNTTPTQPQMANNVRLPQPIAVQPSDNRFGQGRRSSKVRMVEEKVIEIYKKLPNIYQSQVAEILSKHFNTDISIHVVSRCLKNIQFKKKQNQLAKANLATEKRIDSTTDPNGPRVIQNRYIFAREYLKRNISNFIFIDEALQRNKAKGTSENCWDEVNFACALANSGRIVHSKVKHNFFNTEDILQFLTELASRFPKSTIVLDNAKIHKDERVKQLGVERGFELMYIPPCSPQFNPLDPIFSSILNHFRSTITETSSCQLSIQVAHQALHHFKNAIFTKEIDSVRRYMEMAFLKQQLSFNTS